MERVCVLIWSESVCFSWLSNSSFSFDLVELNVVILMWYDTIAISIQFKILHPNLDFHTLWTLRFVSTLSLNF